MEWTQVDPHQSNDDNHDNTNSSTSNNNNNDDYMFVSDRFMESMVRVTFAGFAGALVGLSNQKRVAATKIFQRSVTRQNKVRGKPLKKLPPTVMTPVQLRSTQHEENLPLKWAALFAAFVSILETSRFWSPATIAMNGYQFNQQNNMDDNMKEESPVTQQSPAIVESDRDEESMEHVNLWHVQTPQQARLATILDYTLGGTVAGLAGGLSKKRPPPTSSSTSKLQLPSSILQGGRRSILWSAIGTGMVVGLLAGVCQAGLDAAEDFVRAEQERAHELQLEQLQQLEKQQLEQQKSTNEPEPQDDTSFVKSSGEK